MPPVVIAAAAGAASAFAAGITVTGGVIAFTATTASILASAAVSAAIAGVSMVLTPKPKTGTPGGVTTTIRQAAAYRQMIYGRRRVGGALVFLDTRGSKNKYLDMVIALASHECDAVEQVYFGDESVWTPGGGVVAAFSSYVEFEFKLGAAGQAASALLLANNSTWTTAHKLSGIAYAVTSLTYKAEKFPSGIPNMSFVVRGKKLYDPRSASSTWSRNAGLALLDYLTDSVLGFGAASSEISEAEMIALANLADESVSKKGSGSEPRYTCDAVLDTNTQHGSNIETLLTASGSRLTWSSGKFVVIPPIYEAPTVALDERHIRGPVQVQTRRSRRDAFNGVRGVFPSAADNWIEMDYPPVVSTAYSAADGEPLYKDHPLPCTTSASACQRLAKIELLQGRRQIVAVVRVNLAAIRLRPGSTVTLSLERFGWSAKPFEVQGWAFALDETGALWIDLTLVETDPAVFDWTTDDERDHVAGVPTNLPDPFAADPPGVTVTEEERIQNEDIFSALLVAVDTSDSYVDAIEVEYRLVGASAWRTAGRASAATFEIVKVADGATYEIRARVRTVLGVLSAWSEVVAYTVTGSTSPPPDVTGLHAIAAGSATVLAWTPVADLRLSHYVVRHAPATAGATWASATVIVPKVARPAASVSVASRAGTYLVKAVDKLGRLSTNAATVVSPVSGVEGLNVVETISEAPAWAGSGSGVTASEGVLALSGTVLFDDVAGNFDDAAGLFDAASLPYVASGTYDFATVVDLGAVYPCRITAAIAFTASGGAAAFDSQAGLFDAAQGLFDDFASGESPSVAAAAFVAWTDDDPGGAPSWSDWIPVGVTDVTARAFKGRLVLSTDDVAASPLVSAASITIDMPDRIATGVALQSGTGAGGLDVTFAGGAFKAVPAIGIAPADMGQGDYFEILAAGVAGFTVRFKNSAATVVDRKFDYQAKGYGRVTT